MSREPRIPEDAFFSPDDPIVQTEGDIPDDAFFSPDDPLSRDEEGEGIVTGMDGAHAGRSAKGRGRGRGLEWEILNTASLLDALARELRDHGMAALRVYRETEPMDAMLRSFVAGFLMGKAGDDK